MFWDGTRWVESPSTPARAPKSPVRFRDWVATGLMAFALVALFYPLRTTSARAPQVTVSPSVGVPGQVLTVRGSDMAPKETVELLWDGRSLGAAASQTNGGGSFRARITVPKDATPGKHTVTARIQSVQTMSLLATETQTVSATVTVNEPGVDPTAAPDPQTPPPTTAPVTPAPTPRPTAAPTTAPATSAPATPRPPDPTPNPPDPTPKPTPDPTPKPDPTQPPDPGPNCDARLSDGSGDRTSAIQSLISSVPNGSTICFDGTHTVNGQVKVQGRSNLKFVGPATLRTTTSNRNNLSLFQVNNSSGIVFRDLTLLGGRADPGSYYPTHEYELAVDFHGSSGTVNNLTMRNWGGDAVYMGSFGSGTGSYDVTVRDSTIDGTGRMGIAITSGNNMLITGNSFDNVALTVVDLEPNYTSHATTNVVISYNTVHQWGLDSFLRPWFLEVDTGKASNVTVKENNFVGSALTANIGRWHDVRRSNITIVGNSSNIAGKSPFGSGNALIYVWHVDGVTIRNNSQAIAGGHKLLDISDCTGVVTS